MWSGRADFHREDDHGRSSENHVGSTGWFWLTIVLISGGLFFSSNSVLAGAVIPAAVAMQPSLQAARWIRNNAPDKSRSKACSRFLIATGCWNSLATGLVSLAALIFVAIVTGQPPTESQGMTCIYGIAIATLATCLIGYSAVWAAWAAQVRVWVHPRLQRMAEYDFSALQNLTLHPPRSNYAFFVMAISLNLPVIAASTGWLIYLAGLPVPDDEKAFANACGLASFSAGPILAIGTLIVLSSRLLAGSPVECWSDTRINREDS